MIHWKYVFKIDKEEFFFLQKKKKYVGGNDESNRIEKGKM